MCGNLRYSVSDVWFSRPMSRSLFVFLYTNLLLGCFLLISWLQPSPLLPRKWCNFLTFPFPPFFHSFPINLLFPSVHTIVFCVIYTPVFLSDQCMNYSQVTSLFFNGYRGIYFTGLGESIPVPFPVLEGGGDKKNLLSGK